MKILHSYANAFLFGVLPLLAAAASSTSTSGEPGNERQLKPVHPKALFDARLVKRQQRARGSINPKILDKNEIISPKIVNGEEVEAGTYPWFVSLRVGEQYVCGGFLVSPQFVLTAAHCLDAPLDNAETQATVARIMRSLPLRILFLTLIMIHTIPATTMTLHCSSLAEIQLSSP